MLLFSPNDKRFAAMDALISPEARAYILKLLAVGASYALLTYFSLYLIPPEGGASLIWPPAALALAVLTLYGISLWPVIALSFFLVLLGRDLPTPLAAGIAFGNTLEAAAGAYLLTNWFKFDPMLERLRDTASLIGAAVISAFIGASIVAGSVEVFSGGAMVPLWRELWIGHAVSMLSFGSFFLRWLYQPFFVKTTRQIAEGVVIFGSIAALTFLIYWTPYGYLGGVSLIFFLVIPFIWAALRTGPHGTTLALLLMAVIAPFGALYGSNALSQDTAATQTFLLEQVLIGTLSIMFLIFTSIMEERKRSERVLGDHVKRLEEALEKIRGEDQAKTEFLAILAHELRNPLSPILSSLELMKRGGIKDAHQKHISAIASHVHIMARLLDDLLDMSRVSQKKFKLQKEPVELQKVIQLSLESTEGYISDRKHKVTVSMPEEPLWVLADPVRLEQIFVNLLHNAGKYTEPGGRIEVKVNPKDGEIKISVKDTGLGIPKGILPYIFDTVRKGGMSRRPGGLGIGLSLAKRFSELHEGTIEARSEGAGKGSEFIVTLPRRAPVQLALSQTRKGTRRSRFYEHKKATVSYRVLVVDDNESAADGMAELLRADGHQTAVCYDGPEALESVGNFDPHVVVLDIGLPTMDGYEVARAMRGSRATLIALTGYGQDSDKQKARESGFDHHLVKPVSVADIEALLAEIEIKAQ